MPFKEHTFIFCFRFPHRVFLRLWFIPWMYVHACVRKVEVVIMERMAEAWQSIEAKNSRHDTSHKLHREKPMFCMDR